MQAFLHHPTVSLSILYRINLPTLNHWYCCHHCLFVCVCNKTTHNKLHRLLVKIQGLARWWSFGGLYCYIITWEQFRGIPVCYLRICLSCSCSFKRLPQKRQPRHKSVISTAWRHCMNVELSERECLTSDTQISLLFFLITKPRAKFCSTPKKPLRKSPCCALHLLRFILYRAAIGVTD